MNNMRMGKYVDLCILDDEDMLISLIIQRYAEYEKIGIIAKSDLISYTFHELLNMGYEINSIDFEVNNELNYLLAIENDNITVQPIEELDSDLLNNINMFVVDVLDVENVVLDSLVDNCKKIDLFQFV